MGTAKVNAVCKMKPFRVLGWNFFSIYHIVLVCHSSVPVIPFVFNVKLKTGIGLVVSPDCCYL